VKRRGNLHTQTEPLGVTISSIMSSLSESAVITAAKTGHSIEMWMRGLVPLIGPSRWEVGGSFPVSFTGDAESVGWVEESAEVLCLMAH
jgi:hypothetical protein